MAKAGKTTKSLLPSELLAPTRKKSQSTGKGAPGWKNPANLTHKWQPGQSGNPGGRGGEYHEALRLARVHTVRGVERLLELLDSPDERVAFMATQELLNRTLGKAKDPDPRDLKPAVKLDLSRLDNQQLALLHHVLTALVVTEQREAGGSLAPITPRTIGR